MANYSLLRYPGGKTRAIKILKDFIPKDTKEICSPFFGGGSFEIYLSQKGIKVYAYDNFYPLVCFWKSLLNNPLILHKEVKKYYPLKKEFFYELQKNISKLNSDIEVGACYYVLNRCSFSGTGLSGGMSPNHPRFTQKQIENIINFKDSFNINKLSFEDSIPKHDCLVYADPPYLINQCLYGKKGSMHKGFNHIKLSEILNERENFILSYNNSNEIKDMYKDHVFIYPNWSYGMSKNKKSKEILIISKDLKDLIPTQLKMF